MRNKTKIDEKVKIFLEELLYEVSIANLENYAEKNKIEIYYYNNVNLHGDKIIYKLSLSEYAKNKKSFYYVNKTYKFIFIYEEISPETKKILFIHELAHIILNHRQTKWNEEENEQEANAFAYLVLENKSTAKSIKRNKFLKNIAIVIWIGLIFLYAGIHYNANYIDKYYVTSTGTKYHLQSCNTITNSITKCVNKHYAQTAKYTSCNLCIDN